MIASAVGIAAGVLIVSGLAPFAVRPLVRRLGIVDYPNERSSHVQPTLRAGGLAPLIGWIAGAALVAVTTPDDLVVVVFIAITGVAMAAIGFTDDLRGLSAGVRLVTQIVVSALSCGAYVLISEASLWWLAIGVVLVVGYVNSANFMDGINGISGLHGAAVGLAFSIAGFVAGVEWLAYLGLVLAAAFLAFLPWNLQKAGFFLGDVGSYLLGGAIAAMAAGAMVQGVSPLLLLAPLSIYVTDTLSTMIRRAAAGESVFAAHRMHVYQRLTDSGLPHLATAGVVTTFTLAATLMGIVAEISVVPAWGAWFAVTILCGLYISTPGWRRPSTRIPEAAAVRQAAPLGARDVRRWAVVGGTGFVGSAIVAYLRSIDVDVSEVRAPRLEWAPDSGHDIETLLSEAAIQRAIVGLVDELSGIDVVVNAAGLASPDSGKGSALFGANALLPIVIARASAISGVARFVHVSSAAVQGRRALLDATADAAPFSPYSESKAYGERLLLDFNQRQTIGRLVILRATSVQGAGRRTTEGLRRVAHSPLASVAKPGTAPSVVSSVTRLARTVADVGSATEVVPGIVLQPWEGLTVTRVLEAASGQVPRQLPKSFCRVAVSTCLIVGRIVPRFAGIARRLEVMWFGQAQVPGWAQNESPKESSELLRVLAGGAT